MRCFHSCWITALPPVKGHQCLLYRFDLMIPIISFDGKGLLRCVARFWIGRRHLQSTKCFKLALEESNEHVRRGLRKLSPSREGSNWNALFSEIFFAGQWIRLLANLFGSFQRASASIFMYSIFYVCPPLDTWEKEALVSTNYAGRLSQKTHDRHRDTVYAGFWFVLFRKGAWSVSPQRPRCRYPGQK